MNRKQLKLILTLIVLIIAATTTILVINAFKSNGKNNTQDNQNTENTQQPDSDTQTNNDSDTDDKDDESNVSGSGSQDNQDPDDQNSGDTQTGNSDSDNQSSSSGNSGSDDTQTGNSGSDDTQTGNSGSANTSVPASYKDFSLTKDMSAQQAYQYLDDFLNSKYSILINKQNKVNSDYAPSDLVTPQGCSYQMESTAAKALTDMLSAARSAGYSDLILYSGYRTYASQKNKFENRTQQYLNQGYSQQQAEEKAGEYLAPPGSSEHHTGLAADVCSSKIVNKFGYLDDSFDTTDEFKWLEQNCAEYGFILRYRKSAEDITGFLYEPWHYRYIGTDHAKACMELGITYEEYHDMLVKFRDEAKTAAGV